MMLNAAGHLGGERTFWRAADRRSRVLLVDTTSIAWRSRDDDRLHVGRRQRADHKLGRIFGPQDDVDTFAGQFVRDRVDTRTTNADAVPIGSTRLSCETTAIFAREPGSRRNS